MKNLDNLMILRLSFPPAFAVLFLLFLRTFSPVVPPELSMAFGLLFVPFLLMTFLLMIVFHGQAGVVGIFVFAILCVAVQYYYVKVLLRGQGGERIAMVVATYLLIGLLTGMVILFPLVGQQDTNGVQLTLSKVDKNETSGTLIHFTQQDLVESPALQSLIESGHTSMTWDEYGSFQQRYPPGYFVEYNGTYYKLTRIIPQGG
jgi:amino acid transporter